MPHEEPKNEKNGICPYHDFDAARMKPYHHADKHDTECRSAGQIYAAAPPTDNILRKNGAQRTESGGNGEHTQQHGTAQPLCSYGNNDELFCHERQTEHERKRHESGKTHHLTEHAQLSLTVVLEIGEHRLCHLCHHSLHERRAFLTPVVGRVINADIMLREITTQQNVHYIDIDALHNGGQEHFHGETKHAAYRSEIETERWPPRTVVPVHEHIYTDEHESLCGKRPVGIALPCHNNAHYAR